MIKLIIIDLDGTLLDENKEISNFNWKSLKKAMECGVAVTISTGRSYISAKDYIEHLGLEVPVSFQNGALILKQQLRQMNVLREVLLPADHAIEIVNRAREEGVPYIIFRDFFESPDMYMEFVPDSPYRSYYENNKFRIKTVKDPLQYIKSEGIPEIALEGPEDKIIKVVESLGINGNVSIIKNNKLGEHAFYEFFGPDVRKASSLNFLMKYFNVDSEEVAYIGDNFNDIDVMEKVGLPIAMANAPEEVKRYAKYITERDNHSHGVAEAVTKILEGEI
ncbi:hypothetical protein AT15_03310 [Kosmotoga arenicorallina S304]|uniref:Haloacid dehalogenase n=1 Tax=Kosmotoga arenicorallina S304 TaxID=1453497 RepID=A0A182C805_9BACT|nr:HAD family hydrolase [Kosmotoga arenicorallina]OAA31866.1 hypothetical protein AT15_03310 [Kosmotoga arenicorallina S304]